jgi:GTPase SAR1 family protein
VTSKRSFEEVDQWINDLHAVSAPNASLMLIGNKIDLNEDREISEAEAEAFAVRHKMNYLETSAKTGDNIQEAFTRLGEALLQRPNEVHNPSDLMNPANCQDSRSVYCSC